MEIYKLGEICEINNKSNVLKNKSNFFLDPDALKKKLPKKFINQKSSYAPKNSIVFIKDGSIGESLFIDYDSHICSTAFSFCSKNKFVTKYIWYWLIKNIKKIKKDLSKGSVIKHIYFKDIATLNIFLPCEDEIKKIIDIIEPNESLFIKYSKFVRIDEIENTKNDIRNLIDIIEPLENLVLLKKQELNNTNSIFSYYKIKLIDEQNKTTKNYKLKDLGKLKGGISKLNKKNYDKGILFINYMDIMRNTFINSKDNIRLYEANKKEINNYLVEYGDIIFTSSSENKEEICTSSVYLLYEIAIFNGFSKIYKYNQNILLPKYAGYLFRSKKFRTTVHKLATGYTRFNISKNDILNIEISVPSLEIQKQIIDIIEPLDQKIKLLEKEISLYDSKYKYYLNLLLESIY